MTLRLMKFFMESTDGRRNQEFQRGATMDGRGRRNAKTKKERGKREREEDFAEECHSGITFMNCCEESHGEERERVNILMMTLTDS